MVRLVLILLLALPLVSAYDINEIFTLESQLDYGNGTGYITGCTFTYSIVRANGTVLSTYGATEGDLGVYTNDSVSIASYGDFTAVGNCTVGTNMYYGSYPITIGGDNLMINYTLLLLTGLGAIWLFFWRGIKWLAGIATMGLGITALSITTNNFFPVIGYILLVAGIVTIVYDIIGRMNKQRITH